MEEVCGLCDIVLEGVLWRGDEDGVIARYEFGDEDDDVEWGVRAGG